MAVVVDFDPLRWRFQSKGFSQTAQQLGLCRGLRHPPGQRFLRIAKRAIHQFRLFTTTWHRDLDLATQLARQSLGHQVFVFDRM